MLFIVSWGTSIVSVNYFNYNQGSSAEYLLVIARFANIIFIAMSPVVLAIGHRRLRSCMKSSVSDWQFLTEQEHLGNEWQKSHNHWSFAYPPSNCRAHVESVSEWIQKYLSTWIFLHFIMSLSIFKKRQRSDKWEISVLQPLYSYVPSFHWLLCYFVGLHYKSDPYNRPVPFHSL